MKSKEQRIKNIEKKILNEFGQGIDAKRVESELFDKVSLVLSNTLRLIEDGEEPEFKKMNFISLLCYRACMRFKEKPIPKKLDQEINKQKERIDVPLKKPERSFFRMLEVHSEESFKADSR